MKSMKLARTHGFSLAGFAFVLLASLRVFAADAPVSTDNADMSVAVATRLNEVIATMDAGNPEAASAAMLTLRDDLLEDMTDYEKLVTLQLSANLNVTLLNYPEALADHEAVLQLPLLTEAQRLATANAAAQLYLQQQDWNKGLEHLLTVNDLQEGGDMETLFRIAFAHSQLGRNAAAIPYMEQAVAAGGEQTPEDYYRNLATLYMQTQNPPKAIATYDQLLERFPELADRERVLANQAALHIQLGNGPEATSLLRQLLREYPGSDQVPTWRQSLTALTGGA